MGFLRTREVVKRNAEDKILLWEDIQLDRGFIHVRHEVAKGTRRRSDERYPEINPSFKIWLVQHIQGKSGKIIPVNEGNFAPRLKAVFQQAEVKFLVNGLRHSCISYYLAMYPDIGVQRVSLWSGNSESTIRLHYLRHLTKEQGENWFRALEQFIRF